MTFFTIFVFYLFSASLFGPLSLMVIVPF